MKILQLAEDQRATKTPSSMNKLHIIISA